MLARALFQRIFEVTSDDNENENSSSKKGQHLLGKHINYN